MTKQKTLEEYYEDGWWIKVSPLARTEKECWVASVYRKGKNSWITEDCSDFSDPRDAYKWSENMIWAKNRDSWDQ